ncbi:MAG: hypothetical protein FJX61_01115 [Alphaproteobacteria bacterium]|nr:hypothetical protein [Alphaproteobacteria bacterium]
MAAGRALATNDRPMPLPNRRHARAVKRNGHGIAVPVAFAANDVERVEARFEALGRRSPWRSYGTWQDGHPARLVVYRFGKAASRMMVTRFSDGTFDVNDGEGRAVLRRAAMPEVLERIVRE